MDKNFNQKIEKFRPYYDEDGFVHPYKEHELKTENGRISNVNPKIHESNKKFKFKPIGVVSLVLVSAATLALPIFAAFNAGIEHAQNMPINLPKESIMITIDMPSYSDTIQGLVNKYYNEAYGTEKAYMERLENLNPEYTKYDHTVLLPLVVNKYDENYLRIIELEKQIKYIEENEFLVDYAVQPGDLTVSHIAARASGSVGQTVEYTNLILSKNSDKKRELELLNVGTIITAPNPKLGPLKMELQDCKQALLDSVCNEKSQTK